MMAVVTCYNVQHYKVDKIIWNFKMLLHLMALMIII